jgi:hypothetical protein
LYQRFKVIIQTEEVKNMSCGTCGCEEIDKPVQYECTCGDECACLIIGFDEEPSSAPYCCGEQMKRIK